MARPISRCAMQTRVSESISSSTSLPWARKYSATDVAVNALRTFASGGCSLVETITTERFRPSAPRSRSMNSRTSRPRSPIRPITFTSASVNFAIIPSSTLLPTPEPDMMPSLWPLPTVSRPLMARTPRSMGSWMRRRFSGWGEYENSGYCSPVIGPLPSIGLPR